MNPPSNSLSLQTIFNNAWQRFIVEGAPPAQESGFSTFWRCRYRTADGRVCAIGASLTPEQAALADAQEDSGFAYIVQKFPQWFDESVISLEQWELSELQQELHDQWCYCGEWRTASGLKGHYLEVAAKYGLTVPQS